jgi:2-phosphosulfolactate phosphatase
MKIDVSFSPATVDELQMRGKNVVIVDVLRASTTIAMALQNGAREIIPVHSIENAVKISGSLFGDVTLRGGERFGKIIEGFNLGNSPMEYTESAVKGKSIIFSTTNGTAAITKCKYARNLVIGSFVNLTDVVEFVKETSSDFHICCAGRDSAGFSDFSLEDSVCAGIIINRLLKENPSIELTDSSSAAVTLFKSYGKSITKMLRNCDHGRYLIEIGFERDLEICGDTDSIPILPIFSGNAIRARKATVQAPENMVS